MLLKQAILARLPLICATTRDTVNLKDVLRVVLGAKNKPILDYNPEYKPQQGGFYVLDAKRKMVMDYPALYHKLLDNDATLLVINPPHVDDAFFDAGEVPVPKDLLRSMLEEVVEKEELDELMSSLGGCTVKESAELARLTSFREKALTKEGIIRTRKECFRPANGLTHIDTGQLFYHPPQFLAKWVEMEAGFFLRGKDDRLVPRGLLFDGPPGTGKTAGAKWLAESLAVPLFRVDIGGTKNKYVGESEQNMLANLKRLDQEEPCVALLDEIEKIFDSGHSDASGTTSTLLSQLLWWLAERRSRVLVVMTTNNAKALPKELYRPGRIDQMMTFDGLGKDQALDFVNDLASTFNLKAEEKMLVVKKVLQKAYGASTLSIAGGASKHMSASIVTQSALTTMVFEAVKLIANDH